MSFSARAPGTVGLGRRFYVPISVALAVGLGALGCQNQDDHPAFAEGCEVNCKPTTGVGLGAPIMGTAGATSTVTDAGTGMLTGNVVLLNDQTFVSATPFTHTALVSADGATGEAVTAVWNGTDPYELDGVAPKSSNWVSVQPDDTQGDALLTYQPVATNNVSSVNLAVVSTPALDALFTSVSAQRSANSGQVVLFFRSVGTGSPVAGLRVTLAAAQVAAYAAASGWVLDDGTAVTNASGLVVFGNVDAALANNGTQVVTVTRPATATAPAISGGTFAVKSVEGAATIATVNVQL
ncbi:MAG: hypothetical protein ABI488_20790 [Polyangiaceae bacterium]